MVKVIVVQDGKKVCEKEGEFFAGTVGINSDEDTLETSTAAYGKASMNVVITALAKLAVDMVREASLNRMECIINLAALKEILHSHIAEELAGLPQGLAEKMQKIMED